MRYDRTMRLTRLGIIAVALMAAIQWHAGYSKAAKYGRDGSGAADEWYPYRGPQFTQFVADSAEVCRAAEASDFYIWLDKAYESCRCRIPAGKILRLEETLRSKRRELAGIAGKKAKSEAEVILAAQLHRTVKTIIPRFSLDRGFEFTNVVRYGERQCFLQSVLIAALLQDAGVDAGVTMVWKNTRGEEINNGHAVALVKLPSGEDIIVDASEREPFACQQGLFAMTPDYRYVVPVYGKPSNRIRFYKCVSGNEKLTTRRVRPLDFAFIRSQFYYYRGERAPGGLLAAKPTRKGLETAIGYLRKSVKLCPRNPLAVYMLGRAYLTSGDAREARTLLARAYGLYTEFGWVPAGAREYLALANRGDVRSARS